MKIVKIVKISDGGAYGIFCGKDIGVLDTTILFNTIDELITSYIEVDVRFIVSFVHADILKTATVVKEFDLSNIHVEYPEYFI